MAAGDLETVAAIERESHNPLPPEGIAVFANRLETFPAGCFVAGDPVGGYAIAHPWAGTAPALGTVLHALPETPDHLLLHDLALRPGLRGQGLPAALVARLCDLAAAERLQAQGLPRIRLMAVHGTAPMWARLGFVPDGTTAAGYGQGAVAMWLGATAA